MLLDGIARPYDYWITWLGIGKDGSREVLNCLGETIPTEIGTNQRFAPAGRLEHGRDPPRRHAPRQHLQVLRVRDDFPDCHRRRFAVDAARTTFDALADGPAEKEPHLND